MSIQAGSLDRLVTLLAPGAVVDDYNERVPTWVEHATVYASFRPAWATERLAAAEIGAEVGVIFEVRYSSETAMVDPKYRLSFDGLTYDIVGVEQIGRREGFRITANARAD